MKRVLVFLAIVWAGLYACESTSSSADYTSTNTTQDAKKKQPIEKITTLNEQNFRAVLAQYDKDNPETLVLLKTNLGDIKIKLYSQTPLHRANFLRLVKAKFYDETVFYRVIKDFAIQAGNSDRPKLKTMKKKLGSGYRVPAELNPTQLYHKKGALAMAREYDNNPEKASVPYDFYIVKGKVFSQAELSQVAQQSKISFNAEQIKIYTTLGGTPHLDGMHTVFGEVVEGLEIIDKISQQPTDKSDWPMEEVTIKMTVLE